VFVALVTKHAMRMYHIAILAYPALEFFFPHLINGAIFENKLLIIKRVFWFSLHDYLKHLPF